MRPVVWSLAVLLACSHAPPPQPVEPISKTAPVAESPQAPPPAQDPAPPPPPPEPPPPEDLDSKEILARDPSTTPVMVKHVLIAWAALEPNYGGKLDPRAAKRDNAAAAQLAREVLAKLQADPKQIDALAKETGEDPGALHGVPYEVGPDAPFVPEFKALSLRLKLDEAGIVRTRFGYHVIVRVAPPPPDPLESAAILARPEGKGSVMIKHILISWKDAPNKPSDPRADRTKADADALVKSVVARAKKGESFDALVREYSESPEVNDNGRAYEVTPDAHMIEPFKKMALRMKLGEVALAKSLFGWHVLKRVPPPPPDKLASTDILSRAPNPGQVKVKHILLGWTERHAEDPRGEKRTRAELEKLVKATLARLKKGESIESLMAELSEDPGSAKDGLSYDVTENAGLVKPFKDLSLRLKVGEVGVIDTEFGIHIIQRVE